MDLDLSHTLLAGVGLLGGVAGAGFILLAQLVGREVRLRADYRAMSRRARAFGRP